MYICFHCLSFVLHKVIWLVVSGYVGVCVYVYSFVCASSCACFYRRRDVEQVTKRTNLVKLNTWKKWKTMLTWLTCYVVYDLSGCMCCCVHFLTNTEGQVRYGELDKNIYISMYTSIALLSCLPPPCFVMFSIFSSTSACLFYSKRTKTERMGLNLFFPPVFVCRLEI